MSETQAIASTPTKSIRHGGSKYPTLTKRDGDTLRSLQSTFGTNGSHGKWATLVVFHIVFRVLPSGVINDDDDDDDDDIWWLFYGALSKRL